MCLVEEASAKTLGESSTKIAPWHNDCDLEYPVLAVTSKFSYG